jgi:hypothetical protein
MHARDAVREADAMSLSARSDAHWGCAAIAELVVES